MTIKFAPTTAHAMLDAIETDLGTSPILEMRTGSAPSTLGGADTGTLVASMALPSDWATAASAFSKAKSGTWEDLSANNAGDLTNGHWRLKTSGGVAKVQGSITATGGGGDIEVNNVNVAAGQPVSITSFAINFPTANQG